MEIISEWDRICMLIHESANILIENRKEKNVSESTEEIERMVRSDTKRR